ncbi:hypothetical protein E3Q22_01594 [Wallemia mellicola]|uniref:Peptide hydrolase n=1 Tax=Wallemia mellicola TaxID=1708541 RepID=A0A4T0MCZ5_9BASI|nr:hypothetical protein E3Q22_01594 [Wallemia mellicola]
MRVLIFLFFILLPIALSFKPLEISQLNLVNLLSGNLTSDTPNNTQVLNYFVNHFSRLRWDATIDTFQSNTPLGRKTFNNLVVNSNKDAPFRLTLAAHYDSKYFKNAEFLGATDSAFPCALLLDLATFFTPILNKFDSLKFGLKSGQVPLPPYIKATGGDRSNFTTSYGPSFDGRQLDEHDLSLQMIFFDGEEAFENWSDNDSIYGAKHLAETLSTSYIDIQEAHHPPVSKRRLKPHPTELDRIDHLVLLDLLGAPNPTIPNYFSTTEWMHSHMIDIENRLNSIAETPTVDQSNNFQSRFFVNRTSRSGISDDHLPFLHRGVPIFHVIPYPFPSVWHKLSDDRSALSIPTMARWNAIMRTFIAEYMQLRPLIH